MKIGVQVIGHGSPDPGWLRMVEGVVGDANIPYPTVISYLEGGKETSIASGLAHLENAGITDVIVIPLFISSFTTHVDEIQYALGVIEEPLTETELTVIPHQCRIHFCSPMNDHPQIVDILAQRARECGFDPQVHRLVLVAHGVNDADVYIEYDAMMQRIVAQLCALLGFNKVEYGTFYPATLRDVVGRIDPDGLRPFVLPYFLSEGHFTKNVIPRKLEDLVCEYHAVALLPHGNVANWISQQVDDQVLKL